MVKQRRTFGRIREQISWEQNQFGENSRRRREFSPAQEFSETLPRLSTGYGGTDNMFYFFYKIISFLIKSKTIYEAQIYTFMKLYILTTRRKSNHIALWKYTCWPIKTHVLSKLFYKVNYKASYIYHKNTKKQFNNSTIWTYCLYNS